MISTWGPFARPTDRPDVAMSFNGYSRLFALRAGLSLHVIRAEYCEDLDLRQTMQTGLGIYLYFEDDDGLDLSFEGQALPVGRHRQTDERPIGFAVYRGRQVMFHRRGAKGTRLCAVIVWLAQEWIDLTLGLRTRALPLHSRDHLAISRWYPSLRITSLARSLFDLSSTAALARLRQEIIALELVREAFETLRPPGIEMARNRDMITLNRACDIIAERLSENISIPDLADQVRTSPRMLGALFQSAYGCGIYNYVRTQRLDAARNMLEEGKSVAEAAAFANYGSKTNFSTAFRRRFGTTPRRVRNGNE